MGQPYMRKNVSTILVSSLSSGKLKITDITKLKILKYKQSEIKKITLD
jgi:hypothetical protein